MAGIFGTMWRVSTGNVQTWRWLLVVARPYGSPNRTMVEYLIFSEKLDKAASIYPREFNPKEQHMIISRGSLRSAKACIRVMKS